jgi:hypothetical protein
VWAKASRFASLDLNLFATSNAAAPRDRVIEVNGRYPRKQSPDSLAGMHVAAVLGLTHVVT